MPKSLHYSQGTAVLTRASSNAYAALGSLLGTSAPRQLQLCPVLQLVPWDRAGEAAQPRCNLWSLQFRATPLTWALSHRITPRFCAPGQPHDKQVSVVI